MKLSGYLGSLRVSLLWWIMIKFIHEASRQENKNYWFFSYEQELKMSTEDFENLPFNTFDKENILLNDSFDPESNFFNTHGFSNTTYIILKP